MVSPCSLASTNALVSMIRTPVAIASSWVGALDLYNHAGGPLTERTLVGGLLAAELATLPSELQLTDEDVATIRALGDNTGSMLLKGASPQHAGDEQPDRWTLDERLAVVARRWQIEPERDLTQRVAA